MVLLHLILTPNIVHEKISGDELRPQKNNVYGNQDTWTWNSPQTALIIEFLA